MGIGMGASGPRAGGAAGASGPHTTAAPRSCYPLAVDLPRRSRNRLVLRASAATIAAALASAPAPPQSCFADAGPDAIVGDMSGVANYAASGGIEALAPGLTLCNVGTVWLDFFANTNRHPVNGAGLYRYAVVDGAGRFEQVGISWLPVSESAFLLWVLAVLLVAWLGIGAALGLVHLW